MNLPWSESCEQNKQVILQAISPYLSGAVLEIGSGTGQHAVFFASQRPDIIWQTSDVEEHLPGISGWVAQSKLNNLPAPISLDVSADWPAHKYDLIYSANCFHIMGETEVEQSFRGIANCLKTDGILIAYGPFNYNNQYTSESNRRFDQWLKERNAQSAIRDFEWISALASENGLELLEDIEMPANNRTLIWKNRTL